MSRQKYRGRPKPGVTHQHPRRRNRPLPGGPWGGGRTGDKRMLVSNQDTDRSLGWPALLKYGGFAAFLSLSGTKTAECRSKRFIGHLGEKSQLSIIDIVHH